MTTSASGHTVHAVIDSPVGPLTLVGAAGALSGVYFREQRHRPDEAAFGLADPAPLEAAMSQLEEYFSGRRTAFDLPLRPAGTAFQQRVWRALTEIPYGATASYGAIAARIGHPGASRAVGLANGRNPVAIIVPCHRVIGASGALTGYGGGIERKRALLELERRLAHSRAERSGQPDTS